MNAFRKLSLLTGASLLALSLVAGPAVADAGEIVLLAAEETEAPAEEETEGPAAGDPLEDPEVEAPAEEEPVEPAAELEAPAEEDDGRIDLVEGPRDYLALVLLGALLAGGAFALRNARRQLSGDRTQASGGFRWR